MGSGDGVQVATLVLKKRSVSTSVAKTFGEPAADVDLVASHLFEALVADPEVVSNLVEHDSPDLAAQTLAIGAVEALERSAVDRDLVRQDAGVPASPSCPRNALIEPEQRLAGRRLSFDDDRDVGDDPSKLAREGRQCVLYLPLEVDLAVLFIDACAVPSTTCHAQSPRRR